MSIKSYSLVTLPLPGFQWGSCTIFSYQDVNQILLTRHPPPSWVLVRFVCQSNRIHSTPSPFLGFSEVRARSLVIRVIMSIKSYSLVTLPLPGFQWGSCTIFSHQDVNQIVFTRHPPPSWVLVRFVHDLQLLGLLCQSNRIHSSPSPFLGFSEVRARSLVIRVIMSIKSYSLVTLPLPGFQWGSCTIFSYQGYYVDQIVTRHPPPSWVLVGFVHDLQLLGLLCQSNRIHSSPSSSPFLGFSGVRARSLVIWVIMSIKSYSLVTLPLPGFQWGSCTIFSYQGYYINQIVFTRHPPPSWVLVGFVHDLQLLGLLCQSNRLHSSPSPFLGFSGVRARSLVIRVIMSIKSSSLVTLPLPGFQWGSCTIFSYQDVNHPLNSSPSPFLS